jgi:hypothetical protein
MILGAISRRGNRYLRALFAQAAWVVLVKIKDWDRYGPRSLDRRCQKEIAPQRAGDRAGQQAGPHCMGGSQQGARVRMREDPRDGVPTSMSVAPCSEPSRPSPAGGRRVRPALAAPARGAPRQLQAGTKERPQWHEQRNCIDREDSDDLTPNPIPAEVCERMRRDGGSLFTAHAKPMVARSTARSNQRPDTLMQDRKPQTDESLLQRTAAPYIGVKDGPLLSRACRPNGVRKPRT